MIQVPHTVARDPYSTFTVDVWVWYFGEESAVATFNWPVWITVQARPTFTVQAKPIFTVQAKPTFTRS